MRNETYFIVEAPKGEFVWCLFTVRWLQINHFVVELKHQVFYILSSLDIMSTWTFNCGYCYYLLGHKILFLEKLIVVKLKWKAHFRAIWTFTNKLFLFKWFFVLEYDLTLTNFGFFIVFTFFLFSCTFLIYRYLNSFLLGQKAQFAVWRILFVFIWQMLTQQTKRKGFEFFFPILFVYIFTLIFFCNTFGLIPFCFTFFQPHHY